MAVTAEAKLKLFAYSHRQPVPNVALSLPIGDRMFHGLVVSAKHINVLAA